MIAVALVATAGPARADGDPASDYLLSQTVFVPFDAGIPSSLAQQLTDLTKQAKQKGYPIRVALIAKRYDLGAVPSLWLRPVEYAKFLAQEIAFVYRGRLLVVMPNGFGFYHLAHPPPPEGRVLNVMTVAPGPDGLTRSAITAVERLATEAGVKLSPPKASSSSSSTNHDRLVIVVAVVGALVLLGVARLLVPRLRRARAARG